jgi:hypothetical protein
MDELTKIALAGTSSYPGSVVLDDHPAAALAASVPETDRERSLLIQCAIRSIYETAGSKGVSGLEPLAPAPEETRKVASRRVVMMLRNALKEVDTYLLIDYLNQMRARGVIVPPDVLPLLLDCKKDEVRKSLIPVIGERGLWLSDLNPEWSYVLRGGGLDGDPDALNRAWEEGSFDERCQALAILRCKDPAQARERLAQVFAREKPGHRVKLLESLEKTLGPDDEAFLEACLKDRSAAVIDAAAKLLCQLPNSQLAQRMRSRASAVIAVKPKGLLPGRFKLECSPPEDIPPDWQRDGISTQATAGQGVRAHAIEALLSMVAPSRWTAQFGHQPRALIAAIEEDAFAESVLAGWTHAAAWAARNDPASAEWLEPLWEHWLEASASKIGEAFRAGPSLRSLFPLFSQEQAERAVATLMETEAGWSQLGAYGELLELPRPWSARFTAAFLAGARESIRNDVGSAAYLRLQALTLCGTAMPIECIPLALEPWHIPEPPQDEKKSWMFAAIPRSIETFLAIVEARRAFLNELDS